MSRFLVLLPPHLMHLLVTDSCRGRQSTASDCESAEEASRIHLNLCQACTGFCEPIGRSKDNRGNVESFAQACQQRQRARLLQHTEDSPDYSIGVATSRAGTYISLIPSSQDGRVS